MFKRANKITALLVAAAAVVSIVPATAVNAAERLGTKEGTIEKAYAFKDGKYIYEGYRTDDDDNAVYYNAGSKDKELKDLEDCNFETESKKYEDKYLSVNEGGNDEYLVDLSTGKVTDEDLATDKDSDAESRLRSKIRRTDRYEDYADLTVTRIKENKFGDTWYSYNATTTAGVVYGFTNESGKYVDVSNIANMYVYSSEADRMIKVEEYSDKDKDHKVSVKLNDVEYLTQDKDNIYAIASVTVVDTNNNTNKDFKYLQKISKTQGDKKDDAYLPKNVNSYLLDNKSLVDSGDVEDAYKAILQDDDDFRVADNQYRIKNGVLYVTRVKEGKVKVFKLKMTKIKENPVDDVTNSDDKLDVYVVKKDGDSDHDIFDGESTGAVSIDVDGNTWAIDKGAIFKYDGKDWKEMYTLDRSINTLDVYDEGSIVAYEKDGDVYTTVTEGKKESEKEVVPAQTGWVNTAAGWTFYDTAGKQLKSSWVNSNGVWYMMKADGVVATGWYNDNGTWYYFNGAGAMQTGWVNANGTWYYMQASGAMQTGWANINGTWYYMQASGAMKTGWASVNGSWYYFNGSGAMLANTTVGGYTLGASGAWVR